MRSITLRHLSSGHWKKCIIGTGAVVYLLLSTSLVSAANPTLSRSYQATSHITAGSIVRLTASNTDTVAIANTASPTNLVGIAEPNNSSLLAINQSSNTIQIAISGTAETLVSTVAGNITPDTTIAVSPFGGMGMKSSPGDYIIGTAESAFTSNSSDARRQTVKNIHGHTTTISVGLIPVRIAIGVDSTDSSGSNGLQKFAYNLTGHVIPTARIIIALVIAVLAFGILVTLIYSAAYGGLISIGRNPLAKREILKGLIFIIEAIVVIAIVAGLLIYLLLR